MLITTRKLDTIDEIASSKNNKQAVQVKQYITKRELTESYHHPTILLQGTFRKPKYRTVVSLVEEIKRSILGEINTAGIYGQSVRKEGATQRISFKNLQRGSFAHLKVNFTRPGKEPPVT